MSDRAPSQVVELLADMLTHTTIRTAVQEVETVRGPRGMALCLIVRFTDGDAWTVAAGPHRDPQDAPPPPEAVNLQELSEGAAIQRAREVWPEAEGFERVSRAGWTFRCGGGYAWITAAGKVAENPQGTRRHAARWMGQ